MQRIILVQDNPYLVESRKLLLQAHGYEVNVVLTVKEARLRSRELDCELVIVDSEKEHNLAMELCEEIKLNNPKLAVAVMTGYHVYLNSDCPDEVIRQDEGPAGFIAKVRSLLDTKAAGGSAGN
jgi:DNA-binding NtrC family response regulator